MKLEDQVVSFVLAKRLKELGVKNESLWVWVRGWALPVTIESDFAVQDLAENGGKNIYAAYTVSELGEMLPSNIPNCMADNPRFGCLRMLKTNEDGFILGYNKESVVFYEGYFFYALASDLNEANARAKLLIYLIEKQIVKL